MTDFTRWGLLLVNLGTPDSPEVSDVRRYLREFLSDPRVLDINPLLRAFLLNFVILPRRPQRSAEAYAKIWTPEGSPLLLYGQEVTRAVDARLGDDVPVELAMRYQNPSVEAGLRRLRDQGVDRVVVFPLFPQYSSAAWGSAVEKVMVEATRLWDVPSIHVIPPYFEHPAFLRAFAAVARPVLDELDPELVLMSFHGVPERHCTKSDATGGQHCLRTPDCCDRIVFANRNCYRAQCFATARGLARELGLEANRYEVSFQSRLGRDPWIRPYTDEIIDEIGGRGIRRVAVMSPAFVADCLETIEELGMELRREFRERYDGELVLVPSLNATPGWIDAVMELVTEETPIGARRGLLMAGAASGAAVRGPGVTTPAGDGGRDA